MGGSSQQNEDVPDGMEVAAVVVGEEVGTAGVEEAFGQKEEEREGGESLIYALCNGQTAPAHAEVQSQ